MINKIKHWMFSLLVALSTCATPIPSHAEFVSGKVVAIIDGDTVYIKYVDATAPIKTRFRWVDAPELLQKNGKQARSFLYNTLFGREVLVELQNRRSFDRVIGNVLLKGYSVNFLLVEHGWAMVDPRFAPPKKLVELQVEAKKKKLGIWADSKLTPPWEYRKCRLKIDKCV